MMDEQQQYFMPRLVDNSPMNTYGAAIETLTDLKSELYELELNLRGVEIDEEGKLKQVADPIMNDLGIYRIVSIIQSAVTRNTNFSNIPEKRVEKIMMDFGDVLISNLAFNWRLFGMKKETRNTQRASIMRQCNSYLEFCIRRGVNQGEKVFWKGSQQDIRTTVVNDNNKKGILGIKFGK